MKTLTGPKSTPRQSVFQRDHSHGMWLGEPSSPQSQSQTEQPHNRADKGTYLCGQDAEGLTKTNPGPLCGWWEGERVCRVSASAPRHLHVNGQTKAPLTGGRAGALQQPGPMFRTSPFSLLPRDSGLNLLAASRHLANLVMRDLSPSSSPEPG